MEWVTLADELYRSLGRSSGKGAFGIWTHNLKGIEFQSSFTPQGAPPDSSGIPAVTLQAGEQWFGGSSLEDVSV